MVLSSIQMLSGYSVFRRAVLVSWFLIRISSVYGHKHHDEDLTEEELHAPIDSILWMHMTLQVIVWGVIFPVGMVFGLTRSRWHVPTQVCSLHASVAFTYRYPCYLA